jgi:saccharopine dehydrogenase-like NADP-dependent oxidoreductase
MRITIAGEMNGTSQKIIYSLHDFNDNQQQISSMARTTAYTCTAVSNLILNGSYKNSGINPPEYLGHSEDNYKFILNYLKERNVQYLKEETTT